MEIRSVHNQFIKDVAKLSQKKYRDQQKLFLVEGYHLYEEAKKSNIIKHVLTTDKNIEGNNVVYVTEQIIKKISNNPSAQSVVTVCENKFSQVVTDKVLILEKLQDPGNLGTLLRSALAFGFKTIVLDNCVDYLNPKVLRSTQGAIFKLSIIKQDTLTFINENNDYEIYGTALNGTALSSLKPAKKVALILGNEGQGLSSKVMGKTTVNITIPIEEIESLNVSVAGSIIMHFVSSI
ncbi:MAG: RNA methyltransferase [Candidatus Izemoplasma sp.]